MTDSSPGPKAEREWETTRPRCATGNGSAALVDRVAFPGKVRWVNRVRRKVAGNSYAETVWMRSLHRGPHFFMHLCAALVDRVTFFGQNCGAVFEHAKMTISKEVCAIMSRWRRVPRAGLASFWRHLCAALADRVAFPGSVRRAHRMRRKGENLKVIDFGVIFDSPLRGIGRPSGVFWTKFWTGF